MSKDKLDITSLKSAVQALRKSIDVYEKNCDTDNPGNQKRPRHN
jgi:hypothetical protein